MYIYVRIYTYMQQEFIEGLAKIGVGAITGVSR